MISFEESVRRRLEEKQRRLRNNRVLPRAEIRDRLARVLERRLDGETYAQIARAEGVSRQRAHQLCEYAKKALSFNE